VAIRAIIALLITSGCRQLFGLDEVSLAADASSDTSDGAVDAVVANKLPVACATTAGITSGTTGVLFNGGADTITLNGDGMLGPIDGYQPVLGDRILIRAELSWQRQFHGIWTVRDLGNGGAPFVLVRATDARVSADFIDAIVEVQHGSTASGLWKQLTPSAALAVFDTTFTGMTTQGTLQIGGINAALASLVASASAAGTIYLGYYNGATGNNLANDTIASVNGSTITVAGANAASSGSTTFALSPVLDWRRVGN
jgi:hypothetical protein